VNPLLQEAPPDGPYQPAEGAPLASLEWRWGWQDLSRFATDSSDGLGHVGPSRGLLAGRLKQSEKILHILGHRLSLSPAAHGMQINIHQASCQL